MVGPKTWIGGIFSRSGPKRFGSDKFLDYQLSPEQVSSIIRVPKLVALTQC